MITVAADGYRVIKKQNCLFHGTVDGVKAIHQHAALCKAIGSINIPASGLPDEVYVANTALSLPRLPKTTFLLASMKYAQRKDEPLNLAPYLRRMGKVVKWPYDSIWEGQGETKWLHGGNLLLVGYGFRCTAMSVADLEKIINKIYNSHGVKPPMVVGVKLLDPRFYHMDIATLSLDTKLIVQSGSIGKADIEMLNGKYGVECIIRAFDDVFALNSVIKDGNIYTHKLKARARNILKAYGNVVEIDVSEFEKAGGSVRCMVLTV